MLSTYTPPLKNQTPSLPPSLLPSLPPLPTSRSPPLSTQARKRSEEADKGRRTREFTPSPAHQQTTSNR